MARDQDYEDLGAFQQDNGCLECGDLRYRESFVPGVCVECAEDAYLVTHAS